MSMIKVILKAKEIPDGSTVTKLTGHKSYILKPNIKIYGDDSQEIKSDGIMYIVSGSEITAIKDSSELVWLIDSGNFFNYLQEEYGY